VEPVLLKIWADRIGWYFSKLGQLSSIVVLFKLSGWSWYWYLLACPMVLCIIWWERRFIIRQEQEYYATRNSVLMGMKDRLEKQ
jgi:ferric iron reductase protein FhuF